MMSQITPSLKLLSNVDISSARTNVTVTARHEKGNGYKYELAERRHSARPDNFWTVHILKGAAFTAVEVTVDIRECDIQQLQSAWLTVEYQVYGPSGLHVQRQDVVLPVSAPEILSAATARWKPAPKGQAQTLSIPSHLLCHLDDPVSVVQHYVSGVAAPGDVVCLAESALAIMQGRWRSYESVRVSWLARLGCRLFAPVSSMATACGLQVAIDLVGRLRVMCALLLGIVARVLGVRGVFYKVVGRAAAALDDLTGTLPPFDHFLVLGPNKCQATVDAIYERTGIQAAVVDVNDLSDSGGDLTVLATSEGVDAAKLADAVRHNPGGNAAEQTPLVLVRGLNTVSAYTEAV